MPNRFKVLNNVESFQLYYLEGYRNAKKISGKKALSEFKNADVFEFLSAGYDILHTQSQEYVLSEIIKYINRKNDTLSRKH